MHYRVGELNDRTSEENGASEILETGTGDTDTKNQNTEEGSTKDCMFGISVIRIACSSF